MVASSSSDVDVAADRIARSYPPICKDLIIDIQVTAQCAIPASCCLDAVLSMLSVSVWAPCSVALQPSGHAGPAMHMNRDSGQCTLRCSPN